MPSAPTGTGRAEISPLSRRSQRIEPTPMPIEKTVSSRVTTSWSPPSTSLAKAGNWPMKVAPTSQNQEMPRIERKMSRRPAAWRRMSRVSVAGFQLTSSPGAAAPVEGIARLAPQPASAMATSRPETRADPPSPARPSPRTRRPPAMVPSRMARKVPASISALPETSSEPSSSSGRMPYLSGPKKADWAPMRKSTAMRA